MILAFKEQFKRKILEGTKIHTIRRDSETKIEEGVILQMVVDAIILFESDVFYEKSVVSTQAVFMTYRGGIEISIDDRQLYYYSERLELAQKSGFESWNHFEKFFTPKIRDSELGYYVGKLIHWTDKRY